MTFKAVLGISMIAAVVGISAFGDYKTPVALAPSATAVLSGKSTPHDGMKIVFEDDFSGSSLDLTKWYVGGKPNSGRPDTGEQWSDAHLVGAKEPQFAETYHVENGILTMRATFKTDYQDPEGYSRKWYGAELSSAFPNSHATGSFRKGYTEARMKLPSGKGVWPGFWMLDVGSIDKSRGDKGAVEIDIIEGYGWPNLAVSTIHNWTTDGSQQTHASTRLENLPDTTNEFHSYGCLVTDTEIVVFFDGIEKSRAPLPRAEMVSSFFVILDMAMGGGWPIELPANRYYEAQVDYVRIWSAD